jgi:diguanylate cyclase (GGDEF)-like protein
MYGAIFGIACLSVYLGYVLGQHAARRGYGLHLDDGLPQDDRSPEIDFEVAESLLNTVRELTKAVDTGVNRYSAELQEISADLQQSPVSEATVVLSAAARLMEANRKLQADLSTAKAEIVEQREQLGSAMNQALMDELTGLHNRRALNQELARVIHNTERTGGKLSLAMVDLDHFKSFNDTYGHPAGDQLLKTVASLLTKATRGRDFVARYGGEEFSAILVNADIERAQIPAERIRRTIDFHTFMLGDEVLPVTVSVGIAEWQPGESPEELMVRADLALYAAKDAGRNRAFYHTGETCLPIKPNLPQHDANTVSQLEFVMPNS